MLSFFLSKTLVCFIQESESEVNYSILTNFNEIYAELSKENLEKMVTCSYCPRR